MSSKEDESGSLTMEEVLSIFSEMKTMSVNSVVMSTNTRKIIRRLFAEADRKYHGSRVAGGYIFRYSKSKGKWEFHKPQQKKPMKRR